MEFLLSGFLLKAFLSDRDLLSYVAIEKNKIERCRQNEDWMAGKAYGCTEKSIVEKEAEEKAY